MQDFVHQQYLLQIQPSTGPLPREVELILTRAIDSLGANGVTPDRDMWLKQAEEVRSGGNFNSGEGMMITANSYLVIPERLLQDYHGYV